MDALPKILGIAVVVVLAIMVFSYLQYGQGEADNNEDDVPMNIEIDEINGTESLSIQLKVGETLQLSLRSNPTTGYGWVVGEHSDSVTIESKYIPDYNDKMITGAGGKEVFKISCSEPGEYVLQFDYERPWETEGPVSSLELTIVCVN